MNLALFDFDGTITSKDCFVLFTRFAVGVPRFVLGLLILSPIVLAYYLKWIPSWKAKEHWLVHFFKDWSKDKFDESSRAFSQQILPFEIRSIAMEKIEWHKANNDKILIVSASLDTYLHYFYLDDDIDILATRLEIKDQRITGRLYGKNCKGEEKVKRIKESYNLADYATIFAYGDSSGDTEMLNLADVRYYRWKLID